MSYIDDNFILGSEYASELYLHASAMPVIDYHCHLNPQWISNDVRFNNIGEMWLGGDHYKWRAMRAAGIDERFISGDAPWRDKFSKWAETVPLAIRSPLYHWTHLELKRVFGVDEILSPRTADRIWDVCNEKINGEWFSARGIIRKFNVKAICTTDDPADTLEHHFKIRDEVSDFIVLPTWRPDKATAISDTKGFNDYVDKLGESAGYSIATLDDMISALKIRHDFFAKAGCRLSDHGLPTFYSEPYTLNEVKSIFAKARSGKSVSEEENAKFISAMLYELAVMDFEKGWTQQFHIGPIRNNALSMLQRIGSDTGFDAIDDRRIAAAGFRFFDRLYSEGRLAKTILYNLNPKDNEVMAVMANTYGEYPVRGKMQYGAAWWFLDNESGIRRQIDSCSEAGLLGTFVGMLTDSRSILSYPRHEYFRRILCDILGSDIKSGRLPVSEIDFIAETVENICYYNIKNILGI